MCTNQAPVKSCFSAEGMCLPQSTENTTAWTTNGTTRTHYWFGQCRKNPHAWASWTDLLEL